MKNLTVKLLKYLLHTLLLISLLTGLNAHAGIEITYIHTDALGSPVAGTDEQGNVKWRSQYQPYGEEILGERSAFGVRSGYTGHREDPATGLTYMGARYYSPALGRFMGVDPAGVDANNIHSFNRYAYANNNPYRFLDPDGESPISATLVFVARETGIGFGLGVIADSISQYVAFGEVDIQLALTSNAAIAGGEAGLLSGVARALVKGVVATKRGSDFFKGAKYTDKVKRQMQQEDFHSFPESVKGFQDAGKVSRLKGGDGVARSKLEIPGGYRGREGKFEFIKEPDGSINHRLFKPSRD